MWKCRPSSEPAGKLQVAVLAGFTVGATYWEAKRVRTDPDHADPELRRLLSDTSGEPCCLACAAAHAAAD